MSVDLVSSSLGELLRREYLSLGATPSVSAFEPITTDSFRAGLDQTVTLFAYKIDIDSSQRHIEHAPPPVAADGSQPRRTSLAVEVRYLVTAWFKDPLAQQRVLSTCMAILDDHARLRREDFTTSAPWLEDVDIKVVFDTVTTTEVATLFEALSTPYQPSIAIKVRPVPLEPRAITERVIETRIERYYVPKDVP